jgi:hypothetical protein
MTLGMPSQAGGFEKENVAILRAWLVNKRLPAPPECPAIEMQAIADPAGSFVSSDAQWSSRLHSNSRREKSTVMGEFAN